MLENSDIVSYAMESDPDLGAGSDSVGSVGEDSVLNTKRNVGDQRFENGENAKNDDLDFGL